MLQVAQCAPSGNWSTVPPHRHQFDVEGEEVPYEEIYYFRFSRPQGFGLIWQFDDDMDQAFSLKTNDAVYISRGYHPVACGPGAMLYQLTLMSGPRRISQASLHPDYRFLLEEKDLANQYTPNVTYCNDFRIPPLRVRRLFPSLAPKLCVLRPSPLENRLRPV